MVLEPLLEHVTDVVAVSDGGLCSHGFADGSSRDSLRCTTHDAAYHTSHLTSGDTPMTPRAIAVGEASRLTAVLSVSTSTVSVAAAAFWFIAASCVCGCRIAVSGSATT